MYEFLSRKYTILMVLCVIDSVSPATAQSFSRVEIKKIVIEVANNAGVPPSLALAIAKVGSNFRANALSDTGARGVMRIKPGIAREAFGVEAKELWRARRNIEIGVGYLKSLVARYNGRWELALSHYHSGSVLGHGDRARVSPAAWNYVHAVLGWQKRYSDLDTKGRNETRRSDIGARRAWARLYFGDVSSGSGKPGKLDVSRKGSAGEVSLDFDLDPAPGIETDNPGDFAAAVMAGLGLAFGGPLGIMGSLGYAFAKDETPSPRDLTLFGNFVGDVVDNAGPVANKTRGLAASKTSTSMTYEAPP